MRKYTYLIIFVLLASVMAAGCTSSDGSGVQDVKKSENTKDSTPQEQTTPKEQTAPVKGSFKNPASMGETVVLKSTGHTFETSILDFIRGEKANYLVKSANEFNDAPASGYEYIFIKAKVAYTEGEDPTDVNYLDFKAYSDGVEMKQPSTVYPKDYMKLDTGNLMPGATKEGWIAFIIPQNKEVIIAFQPNSFDESTAYISLGNQTKGN